METRTKKRYILNFDLYRLNRVLPDSSWSEAIPIRRLREELSAAVVVPLRNMPSYVIKLGSRFRLRDLDTGSEAGYTLVLPGREADRRGLLSVTSPVGAALLGAEELETVSVVTPAGTKRFRVECIEYQPTSPEDYPHAKRRDAFAGRARYGQPI